MDAHKQGVASGDPFATSVILWTRVTPPAAGTATLNYAVSTNKAFTNIVAQGTVTTSSSVDYTSKVAPDRRLATALHADLLYCVVSEMSMRRLCSTGQHAASTNRAAVQTGPQTLI